MCRPCSLIVVKKRQVIFALADSFSELMCTRDMRISNIMESRSDGPMMLPKEFSKGNRPKRFKLPGTCVSR
jgi:hypothetical protein